MSGDKLAIYVGFAILMIYGSLNLFKLASLSEGGEVVRIELKLKDHRFVPEEIEVVEGTKILLHISNEDDTADEFESDDLNREKIIPAHKSVEIRLGILRAGTYHFEGEFHSDTAKGKIIVK